MSQPESNSHKIENRESELKLYSLGIVTEDKLLNTDYIKVVPIEHITTSSGKLSNDTTIHTTKGHSVDLSNTILAVWFQDGQTNRETSPNVYANETVKIFKYADSDEYYWDTLFFEPKIRRLEQVRYSYSNLRTPLVTYNSNSSYYIEWSTLNKYVHLHTSNNDGEISKYDFKVDTKNGIITIIDSFNNTLTWNSPQKSLAIDMQDSITLTATTSITEEAPTITLNASSGINATTPTFQINGNLSVNGNIGTTGNVSSDGGISSVGNITSSGNIAADGQVNGSGSSSFQML